MKSVYTAPVLQLLSEFWRGNFSYVILVLKNRVWIICRQRASLVKFFQCLWSSFGNFFLDQFFLRTSSANNKWTVEELVSEISISSWDLRDFESYNSPDTTETSKVVSWARSNELIITLQTSLLTPDSSRSRRRYSKDQLSCSDAC